MTRRGLTMGTVALVVLVGCSSDQDLFGPGPGGTTATGGTGGSGAAGAGGIGAGTGTTTSPGGGGTGGSAGGGAGAPPCMGIQVDGVSQFVQVPDHPELDSLQQLTIEAWIHPTDVTGSRPIVSHHDGTFQQGYLLMLNNNGALTMWLYCGMVMTGVGGSINEQVPTGTWSHVAGAFDGQTMRLFIDGHLVDSGPVFSPINTTSDFEGPLRIGASASSNYWFSGMLDEVRLSRVSRYANNFTPPVEPFAMDGDTIALWHLDEGAGQMVGDAAAVHPGSMGDSGGADPHDAQWVLVPCIDEMLSVD